MNLFSVMKNISKMIPLCAGVYAVFKVLLLFEESLQNLTDYINFLDFFLHFRFLVSDTWEH